MEQAVMPVEKRAHETVIEIDASIQEVWRAITDPEWISKWFAPVMKVEPGAGGYMIADWGPGMEWKTMIEAWEPERRLTTAETRDRVFAPVDADKMQPCRLVQDWTLESKEGRTVLRLVHSGFGSGDGWDHEFEGTREGWRGCFFRLKTWMEGHRNDSVHNRIVTRLCPGLEPEAALARIEPEAGPLRVHLRDRLHLCGTVPEWNGGILNISVQRVASGAMAYAEMVLYGMTDERASQIERLWAGKLSQLFPEKAA